MSTLFPKPPSFPFTQMMLFLSSLDEEKACVGGRGRKAECDRKPLPSVPRRSPCSKGGLPSASLSAVSFLEKLPEGKSPTAGCLYYFTDKLYGCGLRWLVFWKPSQGPEIFLQYPSVNGPVVFTRKQMCKLAMPCL